MKTIRICEVKGVELHADYDETVGAGNDCGFALFTVGSAGKRIWLHVPGILDRIKLPGDAGELSVAVPGVVLTQGRAGLVPDIAYQFEVAG